MSIDIPCPTPINSSFTITNWMEYIWIHKNWYNKIYRNPLEKLVPFYGRFGLIEIILFFVTIVVIYVPDRYGSEHLFRYDFV